VDAGQNSWVSEACNADWTFDDIGKFLFHRCSSHFDEDQLICNSSDEQAAARYSHTIQQMRKLPTYGKRMWQVDGKQKTNKPTNADNCTRHQYVIRTVSEI
jgi:hypothetical protein